MTLQEVILEMSNHFLVNFRCSECSTIFMTLKDSQLEFIRPCSCLNLEGEIEVEDERWVGGNCGALVTIKQKDVRELVSESGT